MDKIEIIGMLLINILMWGIAIVDPRGISHFMPVLVLGFVGPVILQVIAVAIEARKE